MTNEEISTQKEREKLKKIVIDKHGEITPNEIKSIENMNIQDCLLFIALLTK
jgi:hypothetical protein